MDKSDLFELIRKEEVVLWAGAGLSCYAGFPTGWKLSQIYYESLSTEEQALIDPNMSLPFLTEEISRIKKDEKLLLKVLADQFLNKKPTSTKYHDRLTSIPHFKTIITTNYDSMIEDSLGVKGQRILLPNEIPKIKKNRVQVFKVHGDLEEPNTIILTQSDYNRFFQLHQEYNVYWTLIKERLSTKNVLFLGYNLEDPNISVIFDRISEALGFNRKDCFLVCPDLQEHKISHLKEKKIHYINSTAEDLIEALLREVKENIASDVEKGWVSADTFKDFMHSNMLQSELQTRERGYKITSIKGSSEDVLGKMDFSLSETGNLPKKFDDFVSGKSLENLEISKEGIEKLKISYGGVTIPNSSQIAKLTFKHKPAKKAEIDIVFNDGFEISGIPIAIYGSKHLIQVHAEKFFGLIKILLHLDKSRQANIEFSYENHMACENTEQGLLFFTLLYKLCTGEQFQVFHYSDTPISKNFPKMAPLVDNAQFFLKYFRGLKFLEQRQKLRFKNIEIDSITYAMFDSLEKTITLVNGESIIFEKDVVMEVELSDNSKEVLEKIQSGETPLETCFQQKEDITIHNQSIDLGYKTITLLDAEITNYNEILTSNERIAIIASKRHKLKYSKQKVVQ